MSIYLTMGCFWSSEKVFNLNSDFMTSVGYSSGIKSNGDRVLLRETVKIDISSKEDLKKALNIFFKFHYCIKDANYPVPDKYKSSIFIKKELFKYVYDLVSEINDTFVSKNKTELSTDVLLLTEHDVAEEKHQKFYLKHPESVCHIQRNEFNFYE